MKKLLIAVLFFALISFNFAQQIKNQQLLNLRTDLKLNSELAQNILPEVKFSKKNRVPAILYSLLLPGMGELYADNYSTGQYFTIADIITWGFLIGFNVYGSDKEANYRAYAEAYGDANITGKDDTYFANIGLYNSVEDYNREQELNRQFDKTYDIASHNWSWESTAQRKEYRALWSSSENAFNNVRFAAGALILNRIVSAIFAVRAVNKYNKRESTEVSWNVNFGINQNPALPTGIVMNFQKRF